jgi:hypothetical protein
MPQQTKIFRVFVSSTFTDMKLERGILQRDAFPRLEKFCEEKGAKSQAVDLRCNFCTYTCIGWWCYYRIH